MTQKIRFMVKAIHKSFFECFPSQGPSVATFMPFPPLPSFIVQVHDTHTKLSRIIRDVILCEILLHLCYPCGWVRAIKFKNVQLGWSRMGFLVGAKVVKRLARLTLNVYIANRCLRAFLNLPLESVSFMVFSYKMTSCNSNSRLSILSLAIA